MSAEDSSSAPLVVPAAQTRGEVEPVRGPEPPSSRAERLNLIAALLAAFVGLLALGVSAYASYWQRQSVRAQVWPMLMTATSNVDGYKLIVENAGSGPAEVRAVTVRLGDKPIKTWDELVSLECKGQAIKWTSSFLRQRLVKAGAEIRALELAGPCGESLAKKSARLDIELCYCSVLGECWMRSGVECTPVSTCPPGSFED